MHLLYFSPASSVVSKIIAPKYAPVPISGHNEYITFFTKRNFADMIKLKILSWKDCCCCSVTLRVQPMDCSSPGFPAHHTSWNLFKLMSIKSVLPSNHLILCRPLLLPPQSLPAPGSFPMCQLFTSGGQSIGVSASASVLPMNTQD